MTTVLGSELEHATVPRAMDTAPRVWLFGDYNQAESRVVAWKTPIPKLREWYQAKVDVHAMVTNLIAKVIQENKISMPPNEVTGKPMFYTKPHGEFGKGDEERELCKRVVHGSNYDMYIKRLAMTLGVSEEVAKVLYGIYHTLFPEIKRDYHGWVRDTLTKTRTIWMPDPVKFRKVFWGFGRTLDDETLRSAYSCYPQCSVGAMLSRTLYICSNIFRFDDDEKYKDQWCAWYGPGNWDRWRILRDHGDRSPEAILWSGMDVRLNVHDAGGISIPNDSDLIQWTARTWKQIGEEPIIIDPKNRERDLVIPIDFKMGPSWGDQWDLKLAA